MLLEKNSIVVFTGANNSGKSQVLKDLELSADASDQTCMIVVKECESHYIGEIDESTFFEEHFFINKNGAYQILGYENAFDITALKKYWINHKLYNGLHKLFPESVKLV